LSAGSLLAACPGSVVLTVFAGFPRAYDGLTEWDAACGFADGDDVVALRREEDRRAARHLGADARWLDFVDSQYEPTLPDAEELAAAIRKRATELDVDTIALPLGLGHSDHQRTHDGCAELLRTDFDLVEHWVAWADVPYRMRHPDEVADRLESLRTKGFLLESWSVEPADPKRRALAEYVSQVGALGTESMADAEKPEQLFMVRR
jgi:LmbE family N-acetylglucosaminyl deacetylase